MNLTVITVLWLCIRVTILNPLVSVPSWLTTRAFSRRVCLVRLRLLTAVTVLSVVV